MGTQTCRVLVAAVVLAGCGTTESPTGGNPEHEPGATRLAEAGVALEPESPVVTVDGEELLSCGSGPSFAASAMGGGRSGLADESDVAAALDDLAAEAGIDAPYELRNASAAEAEWMVLGGVRGGERLLIAVGRWAADTGPVDGEQVTLDRHGGGWRAASWGDCTLAPVLPLGLSWAGMTSDRGPDPAAHTITVEVSERECTSGRDPEPFLNEPVVEEGSDAVTVYWTSEHRW